MAQIPKGRLVEGPYKPICRDCAIYFSITVPEMFRDWKKLALFSREISGTPLWYPYHSHIFRDSYGVPENPTDFYLRF